MSEIIVKEETDFDFIKEMGSIDFSGKIEQQYFLDDKQVIKMDEIMVKEEPGFPDEVQAIDVLVGMKQEDDFIEEMGGIDFSGNIEQQYFLDDKQAIKMDEIMLKEEPGFLNKVQAIDVPVGMKQEDIKDMGGIDLSEKIKHQYFLDDKQAIKVDEIMVKEEPGFLDVPVGMTQEDDFIEEMGGRPIDFSGKIEQQYFLDDEEAIKMTEIIVKEEIDFRNDSQAMCLDDDVGSVNPKEYLEDIQTMNMSERKQEEDIKNDDGYRSTTGPELKCLDVNTLQDKRANLHVVKPKRGKLQEHYNNEIREKVVALIEGKGYSGEQAGAKYGVPGTAARRWWRIYTQTGSTRRRPGTGGKRISTPEQDVALLAAAEDVSFTTANDLLAVTNFPGCATTVRRRLRESNVVRRSATFRQSLSRQEKSDRLAFATVHLGFDWRNVVFSDEKAFCLSRKGRQIVCRPTGRRYDGRFKINVWAWISARGGGVIHWLDGIYNPAHYIHLLQNIMLPSVRELYPDGPIQFQQQLSGVHTSLSTQEWFERNSDHVELIPWLSKVDDLSPLDNLWTKVIESIGKFSQPRSREELFQTVEEAWLKVTMDPDDGCAKGFVTDLCLSTSMRLQAILDNSGGWCDC